MQTQEMLACLANHGRKRPCENTQVVPAAPPAPQSRPPPRPPYSLQASLHTVPDGLFVPQAQPLCSRETSPVPVDLGSGTDRQCLIQHGMVLASHERNMFTTHERPTPVRAVGTLHDLGLRAAFPVEPGCGSGHSANEPPNNPVPQHALPVDPGLGSGHAPSNPSTRDCNRPPLSQAHQPAIECDQGHFRKEHLNVVSSHSTPGGIGGCSPLGKRFCAAHDSGDLQVALPVDPGIGSGHRATKPPHNPVSQHAIPVDPGIGSGHAPSTPITHRPCPTPADQPVTGCDQSIFEKEHRHTVSSLSLSLDAHICGPSGKLFRAVNDLGLGSGLSSRACTLFGNANQQRGTSKMCDQDEDLVFGSEPESQSRALDTADGVFPHLTSMPATVLDNISLDDAILSDLHRRRDDSRRLVTRHIIGDKKSTLHRTASLDSGLGSAGVSMPQLPHTLNCHQPSLCDDLGLGSERTHESLPCNSQDMHIDKGTSQSSMGPLNPLLPWPRFEPPCTPQEERAEPASCISVPPTQKFQVCLTTVSSLSTGRAQLQTAVGQTTQASKKQWQTGGLQGGCSCDVFHAEVDLDSVSGWWLCVRGTQWIPIPCAEVAGRTLRQERERLHLMSLDATKYKIFIVSRLGTVRVSWHYKFPHCVRDDVVVLVTAHDLQATKVQISDSRWSKAHSSILDCASGSDAKEKARDLDRSKFSQRILDLDRNERPIPDEDVGALHETALPRRILDLDQSTASLSGRDVSVCLPAQRSLQSNRIIAEPCTPVKHKVLSP